MNLNRVIGIAFSLLVIGTQLSVGYSQISQEHEVPLAFGDMDQWVVREIQESGIIGGNKKHLYEVGPTDTIVGNTAYHNRGGSPWANSNVMAKVAGVVKTNTSVFPEKRGDGWCARLETRMESVKVFGLVDIEVVAAGSVFLGSVHEPIKGTKNPQAMLNSGVPFTKKPTAIRFDYKVKAAPEKDRIRSTGFSRKSKVAGQDSIAAILFLQKRWEDKDGNIYAKRVGTVVVRYYTTTDDWRNNATYSIMYGDITGNPEYKAHMMRLQVQERMTLQIKECIQETLNPLGVMVVVEAKHMCMQMRGVEKQNSITTTSDFTGAFNQAKTREEFMNLIRHNS